MIRKVMSITTVGVVPYRSEKEKKKRHKKFVRKQLAEQTELLRQQAARQGQ